MSDNEVVDNKWIASLPDDYLEYFINLKTRDLERSKKSLANHKAFLNALKKEKARRKK